MEKFKEYLDNYSVYDYPQFKLFQDIKEKLDSRLTDTAKTTIILTYLSFFISQFRFYIAFKGDKLPTNFYSWIFAPSGSGKDFTAKKMEDIISLGLDVIRDNIHLEAICLAKEEMQKHIKENPKDNVKLNKFIPNIPQLICGFGTEEGFVSYLDDLQKFSLGSILLYEGEVSDFLQKNSQALKSVAEVYDTGNKFSAAIKTKELQTDNIEDIPVNLLMMTSFDKINSNSSLKDSLYSIFTSQFARRSSISFVKEQEQIVAEVKNIEDFLKNQLISININTTDIFKLKELFKYIANKLIKIQNKIITIDEEAHYILIAYEKYNNIQEVDDLHEIIDRNLKNRHIQALKLSSVISCLMQYEKEEIHINEEAIIYAIQLIEFLDPSMRIFQEEMIKQPYELLYDILQEKNEQEISYQILNKKGLISVKSAEKQVKDLITMLPTLNGTITFTDKSILFSKALEIAKYNVTYKEATGIDKDKRGSLSKDGFKVFKCSFNKLSGLLSKDCLYSPFIFKDNIRCLDNIIPKTNWIVFDIDNSIVTINEFSELIQDYNHHLALTYHKENLNKFRLILELSHYVEIPIDKFKLITKLIWEELNIKVAEIDDLSIAQIYYGYSNREVLSVVDRSKFDILSILKKIPTYQENKSNNRLITQDRISIDDIINICPFIQNMVSGNRHKIIIPVLFQLTRTYNINKDELHSLLLTINNFIEEPFTDEELVPIINQINSGYFHSPKRL